MLPGEYITQVRVCSKSYYLIFRIRDLVTGIQLTTNLGTTLTQNAVGSMSSCNTNNNYVSQPSTTPQGVTGTQLQYLSGQWTVDGNSGVLSFICLTWNQQ